MRAGSLRGRHMADAQVVPHGKCSKDDRSTLVRSRASTRLGHELRRRRAPIALPAFGAPSGDRVVGAAAVRASDNAYPATIPTDRFLWGLQRAIRPRGSPYRATPRDRVNGVQSGAGAFTGWKSVSPRRAPCAQASESRGAGVAADIEITFAGDSPRGAWRSRGCSRGPPGYSAQKGEQVPEHHLGLFFGQEVAAGFDGPAAHVERILAPNLERRAHLVHQSG